MEAVFLPGRALRKELLIVLCRAIRRGRNRLHVLPNADAEDARRLERLYPGVLPVCHQGIAKDHPSRTIGRSFRGARLPDRRDVPTRRPPGSHSLPTAAIL